MVTVREFSLLSHGDGFAARKGLFIVHRGRRLGSLRGVAGRRPRARGGFSADPVTHFFLRELAEPNLNGGAQDRLMLRDSKQVLSFVTTELVAMGLIREMAVWCAERNFRSSGSGR